MTVDLKKALAEVEAAVEAADRQTGPAPAFADSAYFSRRKAMYAMIAENLTRTVEARISDRWDVASVNIAGVRATCTAGLPGAFQNWMTAARRRLEA